MAEGSDEVRLPGQRPGAVSSDPPDSPEARRIACAIQERIDCSVQRLRPRLGALVDRAGPSPVPTRELLDRVAHAARRAMVRYITDGHGSIPFEEAAAPAIRDEVASFVRGTSDLQVQRQAWVADHFSDEACRQHMKLSPEDQAAVDSSVADARNLANELVLQYEPLAKASARLFRHTGLELDDLEQESRIALRTAAIAFLPTSEASFATYARTVIRNHLITHFRRSICATEHAARRVEEFMDARARLMLDGAHRPSDDEVFDSLGWRDVKRNNVRAVLRLLSPQNPPPASEERAEVAVPSSGPGPSADAANREALSQLAIAYSQLSPEDHEVLILRYAHAMSFASIGQRLGRTERQMRSTHNAILDKLRRGMQVTTPAKGPARNPHEPGLVEWKERTT